MKLKKEETEGILKTVASEVIDPQYAALTSQIEAKQEALAKLRYQEDDSDAEQNPQIKSFLSAIDLGDDSDDEARSKQLSEQCEPEEPEADAERNKPWTLLYHALLCVEKLMQHQDLKLVLDSLVRMELPQRLVAFAQHHRNYWVRLISQRLLGLIFEASSSVKNRDLLTVLGLQVPEQLVDFTFDLINSLFKPIYTEELRQQVVKNLEFLMLALLGHSKSTEIPFDKLFRKISFIGRKMMFDIKTSKDRLETILVFYSKAVELFVSKDATAVLSAICGPVLELVYRTYTDDQYERGTPIKDMSIELVE